MAVPQTDILDDFNRADGPLGSNWTDPWNTSEGGSVVISTSEARFVPTGGGKYTYWNGTAFGPNCEAYGKITSAPISSISFFVRSQPDSTNGANGYLLQFVPGAAPRQSIYRVDNGTWTRLGADLSTSSALSGLVATLLAVGDSLSGWYDGSQIGTSRSDSTYTAAGYIGMGSQGNTGSRVDDFGGGSIVNVIAKSGSAAA